MKNNNNVFKMCSLLAINGSRSRACKNINLVIYKIDISYHEGILLIMDRIIISNI